VNKWLKYIFSKTCKISISTLSIFLFLFLFLFLLYFIYFIFWAGLSSAHMGWARPDWAKSDARVKQFHTCINCAKVIKLPSHSSCKLNNLKRQWMEENGLTCFWRWRGGLQRSGFTLVCVWLSLLFSFCFCDDEGAGFLFGFFFFWFAGGDEEDGDVNVGLLGFLLAFVILYALFLLCVLVFFSIFLGFFFFSPAPFFVLWSLSKYSVYPLFFFVFSLFFICMFCLNSGTKPKLGLALFFLPFVHSASSPPFSVALYLSCRFPLAFFSCFSSALSHLIWLYSQRMPSIWNRLQALTPETVSGKEGDE